MRSCTGWHKGGALEIGSEECDPIHTHFPKTRRGLSGTHRAGWGEALHAASRVHFPFQKERKFV